MTSTAKREYRKQNRAASSRVDRVLELIRTQGMSFDEDDETALVDLLTDMRHWCDAHGEGFAALDRRAHAHYTAEVVEARSAMAPIR